MNFPGRLFRLAVLNCNWLMRSFWAMFFPFFDDFTKRKMYIYGDCDNKGYIEEIRDKYFDLDMLEQKFGGKKENILSNYFPPEI